MDPAKPPRVVVEEELEWGPAPPASPPAARGFEDFYRAHMPGLVALARALCGGAAADDVAQEAMFVTYRRWSHVVEPEWPEAWVRRTCANIAVSQVRRRLVELRALGRLRSRAPVGRESWSGPDDSWSLDFWRRVRRLPRRQAQVVALHYVCDLSVDQVASTLEVSPGTVKMHLSRARASLRRSYEEGEEV